MLSNSRNKRYKVEGEDQIPDLSSDFQTSALVHTQNKEERKKEHEGLNLELISQIFTRTAKLKCSSRLNRRKMHTGVFHHL